MLDNFDLFTAEDARLARAEEKRAHCDWCHEPIWDDYAYRIGGELVCEECLKETRVSVEEV